MKKIILLTALTVSLTGCYVYKTEHIMKPAGKECSYNVSKIGNSIVGYSESSNSNEFRAEKDCKEWLRK
ncbi:MAG: hypothetical protein JW985_00770 [Alphaproteobacteria bacterium]|nr:hypothetical protein [Alphaproteobacteria bacterium]MBN2893333.1 hypothetical protein [Bacteroidales bacterium]